MIMIIMVIVDIHIGIMDTIDRIHITMEASMVVTYQT